MPAPRPFALIRTQDQWLRVSHENTALENEVVQLYWHDDADVHGPYGDPFQKVAAGLAFDSYCRLYHSLPDAGRIERLLWAAQDPLRPLASTASPVDLIARENRSLGDFSEVNDAHGALNQPLGLAVDEGDRLFIAESGTRSILIYDLWSKRLLGRLQLASEPLDLAAEGRTIYALLKSPPGLISTDARGNLKALPWPATITDPSRIALSPDGELFVLEHAGTAQARILRYQNGEELTAVAFATDIDFQTKDAFLSGLCAGDKQVLVVARRPGEDFRRFCIGANDLAELSPVKARGYDGLGIVRVPDGRIGFWTARGFRHAVAAKVRYLPSGSVTTFRLDSQSFHTTWGRLFIDACIPKGTEISLQCITADEPPEGAVFPRQPPLNAKAKPAHPELSPPMPPMILVNPLRPDEAQALHRRETGRELPWVRHAESDPFETYEAPVLAGPGRYLWVRMYLTGNTHTTPRVRALRAEYPTHDYLKRIPKTFSREERVAHFLERYLAMFEGVLGELEAKADARAALLDPRSAPAEILPWLASFLGLALDERMARAPRGRGKTTDVRRQLIMEAIWLFRFRGTVMGLRRFVEIYLGFETILLEKFRFRGMGGALLSESSELSANAILGAGFRVGGAIGIDETQTLSGSLADAFATHAHRFSLIVPGVLTQEQRDVVQQILDLHRPSHTLVEICTVEAGMRVGRGLHVALTSIVGRSGGFKKLQVGSSLLGRGSILGQPVIGTIVGSSKLGEDSRPG